MKKLFAIVTVIGAFTFGSIQLAQAQDAPAAEQTEQHISYLLVLVLNPR